MCDNSVPILSALSVVAAVVSCVAVRSDLRRGAMAANALSPRRRGSVLIITSLFLATIGVFWLVGPAFLKTRCGGGRLNVCQENLTKIDGSVQQYILENHLTDLGAAPMLQGRLTSSSLIVGPENFLRSVPQCPKGGLYIILTTEGTEGESVRCTYAGVRSPNFSSHTYPKN